LIQARGLGALGARPQGQVQLPTGEDHF
jgi:hypothetical protein